MGIISKEWVFMNSTRTGTKRHWMRWEKQSKTRNTTALNVYFTVCHVGVLWLCACSVCRVSKKDCTNAEMKNLPEDIAYKDPGNHWTAKHWTLGKYSRETHLFLSHLALDTGVDRINILEQPLVWTNSYSFSKRFWSAFCLQNTTSNPSGSAMTQLQMLLYPYFCHHDDPGSVWDMKYALILEPQQSTQFCKLSRHVNNFEYTSHWFWYTWFKIKNLNNSSENNFSENSGNIEIFAECSPPRLSNLLKIDMEAVSQ